MEPSDDNAKGLLLRYTVPRRRLYWFVLGLGFLAGWGNLYLEVDLSPRPSLAVWLVLAILITVVFHEGVHALVAFLFGYKPIVCLKPPLIYVTFSERLSRPVIIMIALAPLILLDILFGFLYTLNMARVLWHLCFLVNTLGAVADVWATIKIASMRKPGIWVQDTKDGFEIWETQS